MRCRLVIDDAGICLQMMAVLRGVTLGGTGGSDPPLFGEGDGPLHFLRPLGS